ncbi:MAG: cytochrome c3 family protein [Anaerolineae bacterium]
MAERNNARTVLFMLASLLLALTGLQLVSQSARAQETPPPPGIANPDNATCLTCHQQDGLHLTFSTGEVLPVTTDERVLLGSVHAEVSCQECHTDIVGYPHGELPADSFRDLQIFYSQSCANCHDQQAMQEVDSIHAQLRAGGVNEAAVCADCHGSHNVQPIARERHPEVSTTASAEICMQCHSGIHDQFMGSVHGAALAEGNADVPTCTTCHPAHTATDPRTLEFRLRSPDMCGSCHADQELMAKYGISTDVFTTYVADFHGTTVMLFDKTHPGQATNKAVCIDCHGVHDIAPATRDSAQIQANILPRCQECHPDASANFAASWLGHYAPNMETAPLVTAVTWFYRILIPAVVGFFVVYIALDAYRHIKDRRQGHQKEAQA